MIDFALNIHILFSSNRYIGKMCTTLFYGEKHAVYPGFASVLTNEMKTGCPHL